jgi:hypothetical protein
MAGQTYYLVIDYSSSSTAAAAFTLAAAAIPTGGSATNAPTITNGAPLTANNFCLLQTSTRQGPSRFHGALATDGSFNILMSLNGVYRFVNGFLLHLLGDYRSGDLFPVWMSLIGDPSLAYGYGENTGTSSFSPDRIGYSVMRTQNNSNYDLYALILPNTSNWPDGEDRFDMSFGDYPLWVSKKATGNGFIGVRGRLQDITIQTGAYGSSENNPWTGSVDDQFAPNYTNIGCYRFPINTPILWS